MDNEFDIAIVGMSCRLPGAANVDAFWRNLAEGVESIARLTDEEILQSGVPRAYLVSENYVKASPVLEMPGAFDATFFGFTPREASSMDPQQRILLELAYEALEDAGCDSTRYKGRVGVFTGTAMNTYFTNAGLGGRFTEEYIPTLIGNDKDFLSTRISYKLNLKGPSLAVQTACSTSLVAVHLARQSLLSGETDMALAGAISVRVPHRAGYFADAGGVTSPDGHVRAFDSRANGTVFGSGGGIVVLKRLADALAEGDTIHAVIRGSAVNNDGSEKAGYTAPSVNSQADAVVEALGNAGVDADSISYIEAHGSGTPVGDPIEMLALTKAFRTSTRRSGYCAIGSVKTNIGHLDVAAGIAGIIKTVLALKHKQLPPSLHFNEANPEIDFPSTPFYVNTRLSDWTSEGPRRAGVMATGMGVTNALVLLEEAPEPETSAAIPSAQVLIWSAKSLAALDRATLRLREYLNENERANMRDIAHTLQVGRRAYAYRRSLVCADRNDALAVLSEENSKHIFSGGQIESPKEIIFLLPGVGDQYVGMAHQLYEAWPAFRNEVDRCAEILQPHLGIDIRTVLYPASQSWKKAAGNKGIDLKKMLGRSSNGPEDQDANKLNSTIFAQPALFTIEYATARLWQSVGVIPDAIIGHSMGEYVAACLAGVFSLEDALRLIAVRAKLVSELPQGAMLAVMLPEQKLRPMLGGQLSISLINGPSLCVVAGPVVEMAEFEKVLTAQSIIYRPVQNAHAFHSKMLDPIAEPFQAEVRRVRLNEPRIPYTSNVTGTWVTAREATDPAYWARHATHTARFNDALHEMWQRANAVLVECGPGRTLGVLAMQHPDKPAAGEPLTVSSIRHHYENVPDSEFMMQAVGRLWATGTNIDWELLHGGQKARRISLPTYPFEKQNHWIEKAPASTGPALRSGNPEPQPSSGENLFYVPAWERTTFAGDAGPISLDDRSSWLIFADRWGGGVAFQQKLASSGKSVQFVRFGTAYRNAGDGTYEIRATSLDDYVQLFRDIKGALAPSLNILHLGCLSTDDAGANTAACEDEQDFGFFSLLHIAQAIGEVDISTPVRIGVISNRMHEVTGEEKLDPTMSPVLGAIGVIPTEFPSVLCFNVDLADARIIDSPTPTAVTRVLSEFTESNRDAILAYRGKHRWKRKFEQVKVAPPATSTTSGAPLGLKALRSRGVYLITGGTGGLGLVFAKYLAEVCQAKIVLTKKSPFPEKSKWKEMLASGNDSDATIKILRELAEVERLGGEVEVVVAEASDPVQMRRVVDETIKRFKTINGVIHAAGIVRAGLIQTKTRDIARAVLAPKVAGTRVLAGAVKDLNLDFLVLFSSLSSVTVPYAHCDYSAANAFLDAYTGYSNSTSTYRTVSISWPVWKEVGIVAELKSLLGAEELKAQALESAMLTQDGLNAFVQIMNTDLQHVVVSRENLDTAIAQSREGMDSADLLPGEHGSANPIPSRERTGELDQPTSEIEVAVADIWKGIFGHTEVGIHEQFAALGGHSLIAMQIVAKVRSTFQIGLSLREFFAAPTIASLSAAIESKILQEIEALSDDEAERLLQTTTTEPSPN